jgi:hypothetical protein
MCEIIGRKKEIAELVGNEYSDIFKASVTLDDLFM